MAIDVRNTTRRIVAEGQLLGADFKSEFLDFKEMNTGFVQISQVEPPDANDGVFFIEVSLICDEETMILYPGSTRGFGTCGNFAWSFSNIAFRYARICYTANSVTTGSINIDVAARLT